MGIEYEIIKLTNDAIRLAEAYIQESVVGKDSYNDCLHIAIATIERLDLVVAGTLNILSILSGYMVTME